MCEENTSVINGIGFALLIAASLMCSLSFSAPFWVYYPERRGVLKISERHHLIRPEYPFKLASWRGLWAVCFKEADLNSFVADNKKPLSMCAWFWQKDFSMWKTIPNWYLAVEGVFAGALILLLCALVVETLFACCHCWLHRFRAPTTVASFTIAAALMVATSLALYGSYSFKEGEFTPEPSGAAGRLDWAFFVGVGGAAAALLAAFLFYVDGCLIAKTYRNYSKPLTDTVS